MAVSRAETVITSSIILSSSQDTTSTEYTIPSALAQPQKILLEPIASTGSQTSSKTRTSAETAAKASTEA